MSTPRQYRTEGASKSIKRTIRELTSILNGSGVQISGKLRPKLYDKIEEFAERWYRKGFARGVRTVKESRIRTTRRGTRSSYGPPFCVPDSASSSATTP